MAAGSGASFTINVTNFGPQIAKLTASVAYEDNNILTIIFDWGDGFTSDAGSAVGPTSTLSSSYQYSLPGVYTLKITLTDACGEIAEHIFQ